ncbi:3-oxoacyl-[acyl-carrier-protein] reductase FabG [Afipia felis]|jgi:NAD(P)-dependent dehydrogenase (short-subunit alcohol dehydrogenase family)|uniref:3-oxoacyl-[acyl-carrier-protein] reductase FabG n=1 Tax=Afipia felis TaxID=1035 RepID=A0A090N7I9_AFIFE|nr:MULTISPECIES: SDR family NAD(P)-dependent oxidoreductase [Afipia]EFI50839.1 short-chain dehydrogenase/reductase SDR [Afipia sp. 1NLS2]MBE0702304.1 SDR family oxidoreductase [Afipia sp.]CEG08683.1 3-oxoacyl-[acyl-carrier-protein] reductase FabG [Afipia felis]
MRLKDKVAIVTGGASGIGKAMCKALAGEGANVVVVDLDGQKGKEAAKEIGGKSISLQADVTSSASMNKMAEEVDSQFGRIDILINNVGVRITKPFLDHTDADWNTMIQTNLTGPFLCSRAVVPFMKRAGKGRIINTASIASFVGRPNRVAYVSAKAGLLGMTRAMAIDLGPMGITCNAIAPGSINSPMNASQAADAENDWGKETPMGRWGTAEDIANAAVFLALDESSYITGAELKVDGGWVSTKARAGELV